MNQHIILKLCYKNWYPFKGNDDYKTNYMQVTFIPSGMPVAVANPLISSLYGSGRVSARGPYRKENKLLTFRISTGNHTVSSSIWN